MGRHRGNEMKWGIEDDVFISLIVIFQLVIFMLLLAAVIWLEKINNG